MAEQSTEPLGAVAASDEDVVLVASLTQQFEEVCHERLACSEP